MNKKYMFKEFEYPKLDTYVDDLSELLDSVESEVNDLLEIEDKGYENFIVKYEEQYKRISDFSFMLGHLKSANTNDNIDSVYTQCLPIISNWYTKMGQREDIYNAFKEVYDKGELKENVKRDIKESLQVWKLKGIGLDDSKKKEIKEINSELSELGNEFSNNVTEANKKFKLRITNKEDVKEIPEDDLKRNEVEDGVWEFTLQYPSYIVYMKYGSNRDLRKQLHKEYTTRALENEDVIEKILQLKNRKAKIVGYNDYSEVSLMTKMAETPEQVMEFLSGLADSSLGLYLKEKEEVQKFAEEEYNVDFELQAHDRLYYQTKHKEKKFDFKEEELKPYFEQHSVVEGMFNFLNKTFDLEFKHNSDAKTWDEKVLVYDVYRNSELKSRIYLDLESRENKRDGAWMNSSEKRYIDSDGNLHLPVAYITCNFTPSKGDQPSLLTHSEVNTLFHEMGHVLQHICSEIDDITFSGIGGVEWDAVEWSSQFLELFVYESSVLKDFAKHYETGEVIPDEYLDKIKESRNYLEATAMIGQVEYGMMDMRIHMEGASTKERIQYIINDIRKRLKRNTPDYVKNQCTFGHIFSGGYSAGYYSYKWAEVLSVDSFLTFKERGIYNKENCDSYYDNFLSQGSSKPSMEMFKDYMGREPDSNSLVKYYFNE